MGGPTTQRCQHYMKRVVGEKIGGSAKGATSTHTKSYICASKGCHFGIEPSNFNQQNRSAKRWKDRSEGAGHAPALRAVYTGCTRFVERLKAWVEGVLRCPPAKSCEQVLGCIMGKGRAWAHPPTLTRRLVLCL